MKIVVIGAGPAGLGAAVRLEELGADWLVLERDVLPGGLSRSYKHEGFTWDLGGHVVFSHYPDFDKMLDSVIAEDSWLQHSRNSFVRCLDRWVPYPFQNNINCLPHKARQECLDGLEAAALKPSGNIKTFQDWIDQVAGKGISRLFMTPYNYKVWAYPPSLLSADWLGDRVARPDLDRIKRQCATRKVLDKWGPNRSFRYPLFGGTGAIWNSLASMLPASRMHFGTSVTSINTEDKRLQLSTGEIVNYDFLVSTMPLDQLVDMAGLNSLHEQAGLLMYTSSWIIGVGVKGPIPKWASSLTWLYFPDQEDPFYRVTVLSNYSPENAPSGCYSLLAEISESSKKPVVSTTLVSECLTRLKACGLIEKENSICSTWMKRVEYGYPVPGIQRDAALSVLLPALAEKDVYSRGRFGAWKYEVGNMDHSYAQGQEIADYLMESKEETTLTYPEKVNG
ncbi:protoporphyrinogen/coproporphyrinogen oxidase [Verrucomicrobiota bacterium]